MTKQRYSRSPRMPYINGGIPRCLPGGDYRTLHALRETMSQFVADMTRLPPGSYGMQPNPWRARFAGYRHLSDEHRHWTNLARHVRAITQNPSKHDWWESGEITPKLMRLWGMR